MTASKTATVETLTAEVRVLMVGSRQVTLSVYGQLDTAEYEDAELFGRVSPKAAAHGYIYFVGMHRENGSLVRGSIPANKTAIQNGNPDLWAAIRTRRSTAEHFAVFVKRHYEGQSYRCPKEDHSQCQVNVYVTANGGSWKNRQIDAVQADIQCLEADAAELQGIGDQEVAEALALAAQVTALPLIVLAGLR
jgi:hypothetical protein